jgi:pimeloyl-ACP methyl ester carboxylesterase
MSDPRIYGHPPYRVALLHGGPGAAGEMAPVAKALAPFMGVLEPLQTKSSVKGQVEELKELLEGKGALTLVGYSWGAWLAVLFASEYPELVKKLILVSSGPFEEKYAKAITENRLDRLGKDDRKAAVTLMSRLEEPGAFEKFGKLMTKADSFDPLKVKSAELEFNAEIFEKVWKEASELRRSGMLLESVKKLRCPVVAIHGDHDPHPAEGVRIPLSTVLTDFRFHLLNKCGHTPWKEKQAWNKFYEIMKKELE